MAAVAVCNQDSQLEINVMVYPNKCFRKQLRVSNYNRYFLNKLFVSKITRNRIESNCLLKMKRTDCCSFFINSISYEHEK